MMELLRRLFCERYGAKITLFLISSHRERSYERENFSLAPSKLVKRGSVRACFSWGMVHCLLIKWVKEIGQPHSLLAHIPVTGYVDQEIVSPLSTEMLMVSNRWTVPSLLFTTSLLTPYYSSPYFLLLLSWLLTPPLFTPQKLSFRPAFS